MSDKEIVKIFADYCPVSSFVNHGGRIFYRNGIRYLTNASRAMMVNIPPHYDALRIRAAIFESKFMNMEQKLTEIYTTLASATTAELTFLHKISLMCCTPVKLNRIRKDVVERMLAIRRLLPLPIGQAICDHLL